MVSFGLQKWNQSSIHCTAGYYVGQGNGTSVTERALKGLADWLKRMRKQFPYLFYHWKLGF
jgi:hypothetical protein